MLNTQDKDMDYAHMTITHELNVENNAVINNNAVEKKVIHSDETVKIYDKSSDQTREIKLINISVIEHMLVLNGEKHHILHSLWKPEKE